MSYTTTDTNPYQQWLKRILKVMKQQSASGWITVRATDDFYDSDDDMSVNDDECVGELALLPYFSTYTLRSPII